MAKNKTCSDTFDFGEQPLFKALCAKLPDDTTRTQNLIECKDDMVFAWNSTDSCVLVLNWRAAKGKGDESVKFQTLIPSSRVNCTVDRISVSPEGSFLALSGNRGVSILELPRRYGPNGLYKQGQEEITCSSHNLDEKFFSNNPMVNVLQVRWHPASPKDCTLLVLVSNNSIRVFDDSKLRHVWRIGPSPIALPPTGTTLPFLTSLGDTAVDFDIAPPRVSATAADNEKENSTFLTNDSFSTQALTRSGAVEWPVIILRGNGSVYIALIGLDTEKPRLQGPLTMYPSTTDNYGSDSCSLLVLPSNPPTIVIAEACGKLYHMILVESDDLEPENNEVSVSEIDSSLKIDPSEWAVHVLETVELELGLPGPNKSKTSYCPIFLKADINNEMRYFAYHSTGLHAISVDFIRELEDFFDDSVENPDKPSLQTPSYVEYIVCTKALANSKANPVLGFTLFQSPSGLLLLLASGQVVSLDVITNPAHLRHLIKNSGQKSLKTASGDSATKHIFSESFESDIKKILSTGVSQPILKLGQSKDITPKECLELLLHATQMLREQHISKHDRVRQELEKRAKILQYIKRQQEEELGQLEGEKTKIRKDAERLAEMYEEINDRQQSLMKRLQDIVRLVNFRLPRDSANEQNFAQQVEKIASMSKDLSHNIAMVKKKMEKQEAQIKCQNENKQRRVLLPPRQESTIKEIITEMNTQIEDQVSEIKRIKGALDI